MSGRNFAKELDPQGWASLVANAIAEERRLPSFLRALLRRYAETGDETDIRGTTTFAHIIDYVDKGERSARLEVACHDFGISKDKLCEARRAGLTARDVAADLAARGRLPRGGAGEDGSAGEAGGAAGDDGTIWSSSVFIGTSGTGSDAGGCAGSDAGSDAGSEADGDADSADSSAGGCAGGSTGGCAGSSTGGCAGSADGDAGSAGGCAGSTGGCADGSTGSAGGCADEP